MTGSFDCKALFYLFMSYLTKLKLPFEFEDKDRKIFILQLTYLQKITFSAQNPKKSAKALLQTLIIIL